MKKSFLAIVIILSILSALNAKEKYSDFTAESFYGKNGQISVLVRRFIAKDPDTSRKVLNILMKDIDDQVRKNVMSNPNYSLSLQTTQKTSAK